MKFTKFFGLVAFLMLAVTQIGMHETGEHRFIVRLSLSNYPAQMKEIQSFDLDVAGVSIPNHTVDLVVTPEEKAKLISLGYSVSQERSTVAMATPDAAYQTPEKIEAALKKYAATYPALTQLISAGKSLEGRDIWVIKITSQVASTTPKPRIFFNGMHHAREVMAVEIPLDAIDTLLTQYGKDPKVTHWVDANEIWIMPMFNVDGNHKVWTSDNMWRKNTRDGHGVDINRNYPFQWNSCKGSSDRATAQDYHGPSAASEPETHVMMDLVKMIRPTFSISYHSYSEIVIYPYGCEGQHTPTKEVVESIGKTMASKMITDNGKSTYNPGTAPELLYSVDGGDIDWMYHEYSVIPYVIEVNSGDQGFQPSYSRWRDLTVKRTKPGWQFLIDRLDGSSIHGQLKNEAGTPVGLAIVHVERTSSGAPLIQDYPVAADGSFDVVVPAGDYELTIVATGVQPYQQAVKVGATRVDLSIVLH